MASLAQNYKAEQILDHGVSIVRLSDAAQWPFAHEYEMTYSLAEGALEVKTTIADLSAEAMPVAIGYHLIGFQKLRRWQRSAGETSDADGALKIEHLVEPHADRGAAGALGRQMDLGRAVLNAIDVASEFRSVINGRHVMPPAELVQVLAIEQGL